jgi:hypothetical protein
MTEDDREVLELLKDELIFIEEGGYGRSVRTPWVSKSIFQDSPNCLNFGYSYRAHSCAECPLLKFVDPQHQSEPVPCHYIRLNDSGSTVRKLELEGNDWKMTGAVRGWLRAEIDQIES